MTCYAMLCYAMRERTQLECIPAASLAKPAAVKPPRLLYPRKMLSSDTVCASTGRAVLSAQVPPLNQRWRDESNKPAEFLEYAMQICNVDTDIKTLFEEIHGPTSGHVRVERVQGEHLTILNSIDDQTRVRSRSIQHLHKDVVLTALAIRRQLTPLVSHSKRQPSRETWPSLWP